LISSAFAPRGKAQPSPERRAQQQACARRHKTVPVTKPSSAIPMQAPRACIRAWLILGFGVLDLVSGDQCAD
jgi:hypothetical protein